MATHATPDHPTKQCSKCKNWLPATPEFFYRQKSSRDGLMYHCKQCEKARYKDYYRKTAERLIEYQHTYNRNDPEKIKAQKRRYYEKNYEEVRRKLKEYQIRNAEYYKKYHQEQNKKFRKQITEQRRLYYQQNPEAWEAIRQYKKKWYEENKEYLKEWYSHWRVKNKAKRKVTEQRRKARERKLPNTLTVEEWQRCLEYFNHCCAICGRPADPSQKLIIAMDHFIPLKSEACPGTVATNPRMRKMRKSG